VSTHQDRDPLDDRLIRRALRSTSQEPGSADACLDAETLAAWASGTLDADTADRIERHLAACSRCQEMLAVFANAPEISDVAAKDASPTAGPVVVPFRVRPVARWIPLVVGTLAASLLIWVAWPKSAPTSRPEQTMAASTPPAASPGSPSPTALPATPDLQQPLQGAQGRTAEVRPQSKIEGFSQPRPRVGETVAPRPWKSGSASIGIWSSEVMSKIA